MARKQLVYRSASVTVYYEPDRRSIARCAVGPELHHAVTDLVTNVAKPYAVGISPRKTGAYAHSFETNITYIAMGFPELMTRVVAELANTDDGAAGIEWGKGRQPGHHVLGRTLAMLNHSRGPSDVAGEARHMAENFEPEDIARIEQRRAKLDRRNQRREQERVRRNERGRR
jgi:hypothetical protein